jgi:hypothetical protein
MLRACGMCSNDDEKSPYDRAMTGLGRLTDGQLTAWRNFLQAHAVLVRRLEADLLAEHQLPLASYDVLVQLVEAPERRLRMTELAQRVLISRSGLTRLVDRLEREGLVRREACDDDGARGNLRDPAGQSSRGADGPAQRRAARGSPRLTQRGPGWSLSVPVWRCSMSSSSWRSSERRKSRVATSPTAMRRAASSRVR